MITLLPRDRVHRQPGPGPNGTAGPRIRTIRVNCQSRISKAGLIVGPRPHSGCWSINVLLFCLFFSPSFRLFCPIKSVFLQVLDRTGHGLPNPSSYAEGHKKMPFGHQKMPFDYQKRKLAPTSAYLAPKVPKIAPKATYWVQTADTMAPPIVYLSTKSGLIS